MNLGEKLLFEKNYPDAKKAFEEARKLMPQEQHPVSRIKEINKILGIEIVDNQEFVQQVKKADVLYNQEKWAEALALYMTANDLSPGDDHVTQRILDLNRQIRENQAKATAFESAMKRGNQYLTNRQPEKAKEEFETALTYNAASTEAKTKLDAINKTLTEKAEYENAIKEADDFYMNLDYDSARSAYSNALKIRPGETYPQNMILRIDETIAKREMDAAALEKSYNDAIASGDKNFTAKDYLAARPFYEEASRIKASESYPRAKITEINNILADAEKVEQQYQQTIANADVLFDKKSWEEALAEYRKAYQLKPEEAHPAARMAEINATLAANTDAAYQSAVKAGDDLLAQKSYDQAKIEFEKASGLKPEENYPKTKISEINALLAGIAETDAAYQSALKAGDDFLAQKSYDLAKSEFEKASNLKPEENYPKTKISEINTLLAGIAETDAEFQFAVKAGDDLLAQKSYDQAKSEFEKAEGLKPEENYPKTKISEINALLAGIAETDAAYQSAVKAGDDLLAQKSYDLAKTEFEKASGLKPKENYPKTKISEINALLAGIAETDAAYQSALKAGDDFLAQKSYDQAKTEFEKAEGLKPEENYPKTKISEINALLAGIAETDAAYQSAVKAGDDLLAQKSYDQAKAEFEKAAGLKPEENYPKTKISEINALLAGIAENDAAYQSAIKAGDDFLVQKSYDQAKAEFEKAAGLKPEENYPKTKISEINALLAGIAETDAAYQSAVKAGDDFLAQKSYDQAKSEFEKASNLKPEETYPKTKISEINTLLAAIAETDAAYQSAIKAGDDFLAQKSYDQAKIEFEKASGLKPEENYPKTKISEINTLLAGIAETDAAYQSAVKAGDDLLAQKSYDQAKSEFEKASNLKPEENYPKTKISEINTLLAGIAETDAAYQSAVKAGDDLLTQKSYDQAKSEFEKASNLKPEENYPKTKISEINALLAGIAETDAAYQSAVKAGDDFLAQKSYDQAKTEFEKASGLKPEENYPKTKISEINALLAGIAETDAAYQTSVKAGDDLLAQKNYDQAKAEFEKASGLKPEENYPKTKISEINVIIAEIEAKNAAYQSAIEKGDQLEKEEKFEMAKLEFQTAAGLKPEEAYPKSKITGLDAKIAELGQKQERYDQYISGADFQYDAGNLHDAKASYRSALEIFPESAYPKERIAAIDVVLKAELERIQKEYNTAIAEADRQFTLKAYDNAISQYSIASGIKPDEEYPRKRISEITKIIEANVVVDVVKTTELVEANALTKYDFTPVPRQGRRESYIILKARNLSDRDFRVFLNYGKDGANNGGFVINIPKAEQTRDYIVKVGGQYKWFSEDNNWISLQPEGGNVEVSMIQISQE